MLNRMLALLKKLKRPTLWYTLKLTESFPRGNNRAFINILYLLHKYNIDNPIIKSQVFKK